MKAATARPLAAADGRVIWGQTRGAKAAIIES